MERICDVPSRLGYRKRTPPGCPPAAAWHEWAAAAVAPERGQTEEVDMAIGPVQLIVLGFRTRTSTVRSSPNWNGCGRAIPSG